MFLCWLESPSERPTFTTLVKCLCEMIKRLQDQTPYYNLPDGTVPSLTNDTSVWSTVWLLAWSSVPTVFMLKHSYTRNAFTIGDRYHLYIASFSVWWLCDIVDKQTSQRSDESNIISSYTRKDLYTVVHSYTGCIAEKPVHALKHKAFVKCFFLMRCTSMAEGQPEPSQKVKHSTVCIVDFLTG